LGFRVPANKRLAASSKNSPQKRHLIASSRISSAQNGHFFILTSVLCFLFSGF
jgi:hypothetical protein